MKVTEEELNGLIEDVRYLVDGTMTICVIKLKCGFKLTGVSACIDPANYDKGVGEDIAYKNAFDQLWQLEGYHRMREAE